MVHILVIFVEFGLSSSRRTDQTLIRQSDGSMSTELKTEISKLRKKIVLITTGIFTKKKEFGKCINGNIKMKMASLMIYLERFGQMKIVSGEHPF